MATDSLRQKKVRVLQGADKLVRIVSAHTRWMFFKGDGRECPCCNKTSKRFMRSAFDVELCPFCLAPDRYRLLCLYLLNETSLPSSESSLLEVGPIWCFQRFCGLYDVIDYRSVDIKSRVADYHMNVTRLLFDDDSFDWIICYHVLEHIDDDRAALSELLRVLRPGGRAIIQVPILLERTTARESLSPDDRRHLLRWRNHLRAYGTDYPDILRSAGFEVELLPYAGSFSEEEIERYGLDCNEKLHICRKSKYRNANRST